jgi:hypothetical protein
LANISADRRICAALIAAPGLPTIDEDILAAISGRNEAETFLIILRPLFSFFAYCPAKLIESYKNDNRRDTL